MPKNITTIYSNEHNLLNTLSYTDLLIGAVLIPGAKAPKLLKKEMLTIMKPGSVIVDVAVDQEDVLKLANLLLMKIQLIYKIILYTIVSQICQELYLIHLLWH